MNEQANQTQPQITMAPQSDQQKPNERHLELRFEDDLVFYVTKETVDDMHFFDLYAEVNDNEFKVPEIVKFMIGANKYKGIFEYYESKGQKFKISKFMEVFQLLDKALNSDPDFLRR